MRTFKGFIIKCVLFLVPFFVLAGIYFYDDPFKVLREYKKYDNDPIFLNEDYIGWKTYKNYRDSLHFDSFILGNSCTMAFLTSDWENTSTGKKPSGCMGQHNVWLPYTGKLWPLTNNKIKLPTCF